MKNLLKVLSPKRLPVYFLLLATIATAVVFLPSCKGGDGDIDSTTASTEELQSDTSPTNAPEPEIPKDSNNIFPSTDEIVKIEITRDALGAMITGIEEIDHITVEVRGFQSTVQAESYSFKESATKLGYVKLGEEDTTGTARPTTYSYTFTATYSDGSVIECGYPYDVKDGKRYLIDGEEYLMDILHNSNGGVSIVTKEQLLTLNDLGIKSGGVSAVRSLLSVDGTTRALTTSDGDLLTLPPIETIPGLTYNDGCYVFSVSIEEPTELDYTESLLIESVDKTRSVTCYGGTNGVIRCEDDGEVTWHRTYSLDDSNTEFNYADILISSFKLEYNAQ